MNKRVLLGAAVLGIAAIIGGLFYLSNKPENSEQAGGSEISQVFVGGDLHTLTAIGDRLYVTGHEGAGVSADGGKSWLPIASLENTDVMGWSKTSTGFLVGGHPGLFQSTDGGATFTKIAFYGAASDVHSIGASGDTVYLASPEIGLLASTDGGATWLLRNAQVGQGFMGSMLVDPTNPQRVIAPDMQTGLVTSDDGGVTWRSFGGPMGAMSVTWNPMNTKQLAAIGMGGGAISNDDGRTWEKLSLPQGSSAVAYSGDGRKLYVAALIGTNAQISASTDGGKNWDAVSASTTTSDAASTMDPDMPGMDHGETAAKEDHGETAAEEDHGETAAAQRPLALTLGVFGLGTLLVLLGAIVLRRRDRARNLAKKAARLGSSTRK